MNNLQKLKQCDKQNRRFLYWNSNRALLSDPTTLVVKKNKKYNIPGRWPTIFEHLTFWLNTMSAHKSKPIP